MNISDNDQHLHTDAVQGVKQADTQSSMQSFEVVSKTRSREEIAVSWLQAIGTLVISAALLLLTQQQIEIAKATADRDYNIAQENREKDLKIAEDNRQQDLDKAKDEQQHQIMSAYLSHMTELLLENNLRYSDEIDEVRTVAEAITLNAARTLNTERKGQLVKFLYEANLIGDCPSMSKANTFTGKGICSNTSSILELNEIPLEGAEFKSLVLPGINLEGAKLSKAKLGRVGLDQANMNSAVLEGADLTGATVNQAQLHKANLKGAFLSNAYLVEANLTNAKLEGADLAKAILVNADLSCAELQGANLKDAQVRGAKFKGATYDDKTVFPEGFDKKKQGMREFGDGKSCVVE